MQPLRKPKFEREPENAPGAFYVAKDECTTCMLPVEIAPGLMGFTGHSDNSINHCYFKRQPVTLEEMELAIEIVGSSCCGALRYCGTDQSIIDKILTGGNPDAVD